MGTSPVETFAADVACYANAGIRLKHVFDYLKSNGGFEEVGPEHVERRHNTHNIHIQEGLSITSTISLSIRIWTTRTYHCPLTDHDVSTYNRLVASLLEEDLKWESGKGSSVINAVKKQFPVFDSRGITIHIRAITSDVNTDRAKVLEDKRVQMCAVDRYDEKLLTAACKGANYIFAMTDFWRPYLKAAAAGSPNPEDIAEFDELQQGRIAVNAALATIDTLDCFIFSSLPDENAISNGRYNLSHYAAKTATVKYIKEQTKTFKGKTLMGLTTILWVSYYMENWVNLPYAKVEKTGEDSYIIRTPMPGNAPLVLTATRDIGLYVARILAVYGSRFINQKLPILAASDRLTMDEMTATFAKVLGKNVTYETTSAWQFAQEDLGLCQFLADMFAYKIEYGYCGEAKALEAKQLGIPEDKLTTWEEFVKSHDWTSFLQVQSDDGQ
ncbi:MAG: hypothetical protein Q9181_008198, partial [Wetmoreana brouardii]